MYSDRVESGTRGSILDRLDNQIPDNSSRRRHLAGKRQRQDDDKWEHDLRSHDKSQVSNTKDLRIKLQNKRIKQAAQSVKGSLSGGGMRDLREKLSGSKYLPPVDTLRPVDTAQPQPKPVLQGSEPARKSVTVPVPVPETKKVDNSISKKKTAEKAESVDDFLQSLGLEKYSITFLAEEVDMAALLHMTDADLKAIGIPMGPRKKIVLALESK